MFNYDSESWFLHILQSHVYLIFAKSNMSIVTIFFLLIFFSWISSWMQTTVWLIPVIPNSCCSFSKLRLPFALNYRSEWQMTTGNHILQLLGYFNTSPTVDTSLWRTYPAKSEFERQVCEWSQEKTLPATCMALSPLFHVFIFSLSAIRHTFLLVY